jgi:hypothetical protein
MIFLFNMIFGRLQVSAHGGREEAKIITFGTSFKGY